MEEEEPEQQVLEYETPLRRPRKQATEYYREPPGIAKWTSTDVLIWVIGFLVVTIVATVVVARWLGKIK